MPQRPKGARLVWRPERRDGAGKLKQRGVWVIRDAGGRERSTGCGADDLSGAERALAAYLAETRAERVAASRRRDPAEVPVADVLLAYWHARGGQVARPDELRTRLRYLADWWGDRAVDDIGPDLCAAYVRHRRSPSAARRELEDLRAAILRAYEAGILVRPVPVVLPDRSPPRQRWLTRSEAARLLWAAYRGQRRAHIARWILVALYTGTRAGAICGAAAMPSPGRGYVDLERGVFYRAAPGERETRKRKPPIRLPDRLLAHLRRWHRLGLSRRHVVEYQGRPVARITKGFANAARAAGLDPHEVTPHVLRHTAVTWAMQGGADPWEAAGYFGLSRELIETRYGHHSPDHQRSVHAAFRRRAS